MHFTVALERGTSHCCSYMTESHHLRNYAQQLRNDLAYGRIVFIKWDPILMTDNLFKMTNKGMQRNHQKLFLKIQHKAAK